MMEEGKKVLVWAEKEHEKNTWPRADYQEMLQLVIFCLGGCVKNFNLRIPGPDHHARWMSKVLYYLKIHLLQNHFQMSEDEKLEVQLVTEFILIFYAKAWFESPLTTSAARNDLTFMRKILTYRTVRPKMAFTVMQSCRRHLWYLVLQTVVLLVD